MSGLVKALNSLPLVSTTEYSYLCPKTGYRVYQQPYKWFPVDNNIYQGRGTNRIRFDIPNTNIWNFTPGYITFDLTLTSDGIVLPPSILPPYVRMREGTWSFIQRARHLDNLQPIEEIFPYNLIYSFLWTFVQNQVYANQVGPDLLGIGTQTTRNLWGTQTRKFCLPINLSWITTGPFPAKYMRNTQSIELFLEDPSVCLESNCGALNYTMSNVEIHAFKMLPGFPGTEIGATFIHEWEESLAREIRSGQYKVMVDQWDWYQNASVQVTGDYLIPIKTAAIKGIYTVLSNVNNVGNPQIDYTMNTYPKLDVSQFYLKVFTMLYPEQPVECRGKAIEAYQFYLAYVNGWRISGFLNSDQPDFPNAINSVPVENDEFNSIAFAMIADFRSTRYKDAINPIFNTDSSSTDTRFYLRFDTAPPAGTSLYHFAQSSSIFGVDANGYTYCQLN
jgi:hypothetical protein